MNSSESTGSIPRWNKVYRHGDLDDWKYRHGHLHPEGQFVLGNPCKCLGVAYMPVLVFVEVLERVEGFPSGFSAHSLGI